MCSCLSRTNDADMILFIRNWVDMHNDHHCDYADDANRMPSLFSIHDPVGQNDMKRVFPNLLCQLKVHTMFAQI